MADPLYERALKILENGDDIPPRVTNALLAAFIKASYQSGKETLSVAKKNREDLKELLRSPSIMWYLRNRTGRFLAATLSVFVFSITAWFFLYLLAQTPGVAALVANVLNLPPP